VLKFLFLLINQCVFDFEAMRFVVLSCLALVALASGEIFSSIEELARLYTNQEVLVEEFENLISNLNDDVERLKR
jgi:hypothetical protein